MGGGGGGLEKEYTLLTILEGLIHVCEKLNYLLLLIRLKRSALYWT